MSRSGPSSSQASNRLEEALVHLIGVFDRFIMSPLGFFPLSPGSLPDRLLVAGLVLIDHVQPGCGAPAVVAGTLQVVGTRQHFDACLVLACPACMHELCPSRGHCRLAGCAGLHVNRGYAYDREGRRDHVGDHLYGHTVIVTTAARRVRAAAVPLSLKTGTRRGRPLLETEQVGAQRISVDTEIRICLVSTCSVGR